MEINVGEFWAYRPRLEYNSNGFFNHPDFLFKICEVGKNSVRFENVSELEARDRAGDSNRVFVHTYEIPMFKKDFVRFDFKKSHPKMSRAHIIISILIDRSELIEAYNLLDELGV